MSFATLGVKVDCTEAYVRCGKCSRVKSVRALKMGDEGMLDAIRPIRLRGDASKEATNGDVHSDPMD